MLGPGKQELQEEQVEERADDYDTIRDLAQASIFSLSLQWFTKGVRHKISVKMSKRNAASSSEDVGQSDLLDPPVTKKIRGDSSSIKKANLSSNVKVLFEPFQLGGVANLDELEVKTLKFQNKKLGLRLTQRLAIEEELRSRIDQLEKRQTQDDAVINVIHRYWNQLNEDMRILLQRFDAETGDEEEKSEESEATTSFLTQLATWHKQELDDKLASRVQVSQRAVAKIIQVNLW